MQLMKKVEMVIMKIEKTKKMMNLIFGDIDQIKYENGELDSGGVDGGDQNEVQSESLSQKCYFYGDTGVANWVSKQGDLGQYDDEDQKALF
ncbi:MAG: hypothetical protein EZS28_030060 [Streblomastix strix]|uniref:Uncharacterized protein n=1 Tax=Streblomastix strix TaxID=222440 RepID=A0A5J4UVS9_9EUKA|nr:MAG: hypothetical protein EZS28_030060 [Streblomastix strix]